MKTLYLHIGTPKTASTAIQKFCSKNRDLLIQKGFYFPKSIYHYPRIGFHRNAHFMYGTLYDEAGNRLKEQEDTLFEKGMKKIVKDFRTHDTLILSDEGLWYASSYVRKNLWTRLQNHAKKNGYTIHIIVYLRRQDQFLTSRWNQRVKQNTTRESWEDEFARIMETQNLMLHYAEKLDDLSEHFGKENITVRRFDRNSFPNGDILADFLQILGLELTDEYEMAEDEDNTSLKGNIVEMKRIINNIPYLERKEISYLGHLMKDGNAQSDSRYRYQMMSPDETKAFLSLFQEANDRVAREYIGDDKPLFDDKISSLPKWEHDNSAMTDDLVQFIATSHIYMRREVTRTNEELAAIREEFVKMQDELTKIQAEFNRVNTELDKRKNEINDLKHKLKHPIQTVFQKK
jgi:hypothetical protein